MEYTSSRKKSREKGSLVKNILQMLGLSRAFEGSTSVREEESGRMGVPIGYDSFNIHAWKASESAMLEAERKKAKALMETQKRHFI